MMMDEHLDYLSYQAHDKISNSGSIWPQSNVVLSLTPLCITLCGMYAAVEFKVEMRGYRVRSAVKSMLGSCKELEIISQHSHQAAHNHL